MSEIDQPIEPDGKESSVLTEISLENLRQTIELVKQAVQTIEDALAQYESTGETTMPAGGATYNLSDPAPHVPVRGPKEKAIKGTNGGGKTTIKENKGS